MAGDWIAMRSDLHDDPAVIAISLQLGIDTDSVVGKLLRVWGWFDAQTINGRAACASREWLDEKARQKNFSEALQTVGWLRIEDGAMSIPRFDRWNGNPSKRRLLDTRRKRVKRPQKIRKSSASKADKNGTTGPDRTGEERTTTGTGEKRAGKEAGPGRPNSDGAVQMLVVDLSDAFGWNGATYAGQRRAIRKQAARILECIPAEATDAVRLAQAKATATPRPDKPVAAWWADMKKRYPILESAQ